MTRTRYLLTCSLLGAPFAAAHADTLQCGHDLVSIGDTEAQVVEHCGPPDKREGNTWTYSGQGQLPKTLTFGNGVIMFINTGEPTDFENESPLGDHP